MSRVIDQKSIPLNNHPVGGLRYLYTDEFEISMDIVTWTDEFGSYQKAQVFYL